MENETTPVNKITCDVIMTEGRVSGFVTAGKWRGPWERVLRKASPGRVVLCDLSYPSWWPYSGRTWLSLGRKTNGPNPRHHHRWLEIMNVLETIKIHLFFKSHNHIRKEKIGPTRAESDLPQEKVLFGLCLSVFKKDKIHFCEGQLNYIADTSNAGFWEICCQSWDQK